MSKQIKYFIYKDQNIPNSYNDFDGTHPLKINPQQHYMKCIYCYKNFQFPKLDKSEIPQKLKIKHTCHYPGFKKRTIWYVTLYYNWRAYNKYTSYISKTDFAEYDS